MASDILPLTPRSDRVRPKRQWSRALKALRALLRSPDSTGLAVEVFDALDPDIHRRTLQRMLAHDAGREVFVARPSLRDALGDRDALEALSEGSVGRAYLEHLDRYALDPSKLLGLQQEAARTRSYATSPDLAWISERSQLTHDLWHVLTRYGADEPGESALLLFSLAQSGGRANLILAIGANLHTLRRQGPSWLIECWRAWRAGRSAGCLAALPYERLLPLPLEEARRLACLA